MVISGKREKQLQTVTEQVGNVLSLGLLNYPTLPALPMQDLSESLGRKKSEPTS